MKISTILIISSVIIIIVSYMYYNNKNFYFTEPPPRNIPKLNCENIINTRLMEDFAKIDENTIITGGANFLDLYATYSIYNPGYEFKQGTMHILDIKSKKFRDLKIKNFPAKLNFFPHGMKIFNKKYIYIINHTLNSKGGERIEIFEIIKENGMISYLNYIKSIKLPDEFISITNNLAIVEEDDIFFSTSFVVPIPTIDNANFFNKFIFFFLQKMNILLNLKWKYLYHYKNGKITKINKSNSWLNNGVAYDPINRYVFVAQTHENLVRVFKYEKNGDVNLVKDIYLGYKPDNLIYDEKDRILSVGISGFGGYGGLAEIYVDKNLSFFIPYYDTINMTSASAMKIENKIYIVSPVVNHLLLCL